MGRRFTTGKIQARRGQKSKKVQRGRVVTESGSAVSRSFTTVLR